jgi:predicted urease superfamily metal-dependent hydrolase
MGEEKKEKENFLDNLNKQFTEFVGSVFGESGREFIEETSEKIKDFSSDAIKKFMEFADDAIDKLNLKENEQVIKTRDSVEDLLKQAGLLKEEEEEEEF